MECIPSPTILFIQKLPTELSDDETTDLLKYFGAISVSVMSSRGHMKGSAFAEFSSLDDADIALKKLHQARLFGSRLVVQYSDKTFMPVDPSESLILPEPPMPRDVTGQSTSEAGQSSSISDPSLHYLYPPPTQNTLNNISHALVAVPQFYIQMLHLMNKMNLPPPFSHSSEKSIFESSESTLPPPLPSSSESEMESDHETTNQPDKHLIEKEILAEKRIATQAFIDKNIEPERKRKREFSGDAQNAPLIVSISKNEVGIKEVVGHADMGLTENRSPSKDITSGGNDLIDYSARKQQDLPVPVDISSIPLPPQNKDNSKMPFVHNKVDKISNMVTNTDANANNDGTEQINSFPTSSNDTIQMIDSNQNSKEGQSTNNSVSASSTSDFEKFRASLRTKCMGADQLSELNAFKKNLKGDPSCKLYLKNLNHKLVQEKDLIELFKPYFDFYQNDQDVNDNMVIKLMTRGQMKGQAFVTLPSLKAASTALSDLHGYLLFDKPMAIMYAKSK